MTATQTSTPPHQSSSRSSRSGSIASPGLWFSREARTFVAVSEDPSTSPLCHFVAQLPGPWEQVSGATNMTERDTIEAAKRHVDSLDMPKTQRDPGFNVILNRVSSGGTWLDLDDGSLFSVPNFRESESGSLEIVSRSRGEQPAFRRLSTEQIPSDENKRDGFLNQMAEVAERAGFGSIIAFI